MTAQFSETLHYEDKTSAIHGEPLCSYLHEQGLDRSVFIAESSACWRGYKGAWAIKDDKLFLIGFKGNLGFDDAGEMMYAGINYLFPHQKEVFAQWFSGRLTIPQGELLEYIHRPYASIYEMEIVLVFKNGILIERSVNDNLAKLKRKNSFYQRTLRFMFRPLKNYINRKQEERDAALFTDDTFIGRAHNPSKPPQGTVEKAKSE